MGVGSRKHKGPRARERERIKGANQGPKRIGATKPPSGLRPTAGLSTSKFVGKKAKKAAATAAAWALLESTSSKKPNKSRKPTFSY